ncbi:MAG: F0F1 ATP synthase subunit gamma, partial [Ectothiorhodospiraceae bacterium]
LGRAAKEYGPLHVAALYQQPGQEQPTAEPIFPPYRDSPPAQVHADPPVLNLAPRDFLEALVDEYLRCVLEGILITSLLAESQARTSHLEAALDRLDERTEGLRRQRNQFRQEEITEEIEVILLSVEAMAEEHEAFMRRTSDGT